MAKTKFEVPPNFMRLNPKGKRKVWVAALRSGAFSQGQNRLTTVVRDEKDHKQGEENCCLGVACELLVQAGHLKRVPRKRDVNYAPVDDQATEERREHAGEDYSTELDDPLLDLFGVTHEQQADLIQTNDGASDITGNFPLIADMIEKF